MSCSYYGFLAGSLFFGCFCMLTVELTHEPMQTAQALHLEPRYRCLEGCALSSPKDTWHRVLHCESMAAQFSTITWDMPSAELLIIQDKLCALIQGIEITEGGQSLLSLHFFNVFGSCQQIKIRVETCFKQKCNVTPTNHPMTR